MSVTTYLTIDFQDDNDTGANDNDGYKIYRSSGPTIDPCPQIDADGKPFGTSLPNLIHTETDPAKVGTGTGVRTFQDNNVTGGVQYYYRISFTRGSEERVGNVVGPVKIASADELGYPNNIPSHTSGVPNFIDTEPLMHCDAAYDYQYNGIVSGDYIGGAHNNVYMENLTGSTYGPHVSGMGHSSWNIHGSNQPGYALHMSDDYRGASGTEPPLPMVGGPNQYSWNVYTTSNSDWPALGFPSQAGQTYGNWPSSQDHWQILMDEGVSIVSVGRVRTSAATNNTVHVGFGMSQGQINIYGETQMYRWSDKGLSTAQTEFVVPQGINSSGATDYIPGGGVRKWTMDDTGAATIQYSGPHATTGYPVLANNGQPSTLTGIPGIGGLGATGATDPLEFWFTNWDADGGFKVWRNGGAPLIDEAAPTHSQGGATYFPLKPIITQGAYAHNRWNQNFNPLNHSSPVAEVLVFPKMLDATNAGRLHTYFQQKYANYLFPTQQAITGI